MKRIIYVFIAAGLAIVSCKKESTEDVTYGKVDKSFEVKKSMEGIKRSDDEVSMRIDSIAKGHINAEIISTGVKCVNLKEGVNIGFEIIDLNQFNPNSIPENLDSLAIRVVPKDVEILDNSTYGYPDAFSKDDVISTEGNWISNGAVLATLGPGGNFYNKDNKYLAIRFMEGNDYNYGWVKLSCSDNNHVLDIHDFAHGFVGVDEYNAGEGSE